MGKAHLLYLLYTCSSNCDSEVVKSISLFLFFFLFHFDEQGGTVFCLINHQKMNKLFFPNNVTNVQHLISFCEKTYFKDSFRSSCKILTTNCTETRDTKTKPWRDLIYLQLLTNPVTAYNKPWTYIYSILFKL